MGRGNIKQRNEIYAERSKTRKIARLHQEMGYAQDNIDKIDQAADDCDKHIEQIKVNAKNVVMSILLILVIFAIPQFESSRKPDIVFVFGEFLKVLSPVADCGLIGILFYSSIVSFWDGLSVLNVRYVEFLVALSFNTVQEYVLVMIIGKTFGGFITYRMS